MPVNLNENISCKQNECININGARSLFLNEKCVDLYGATNMNGNMSDFLNR